MKVETLRLCQICSITSGSDFLTRLIFTRREIIDENVKAPHNND